MDYMLETIIEIRWSLEKNWVD